MKDLHPLSLRIEKVRKLLGISKQGLAEFLQISPSAYTQILNRGIISEIHLIRLKTLKNVNTEFILNGSMPEIIKTRTETINFDFTNVNKVSFDIVRNEDLHPIGLSVTVEYSA
jgi:transcriptional regulator with XRE-family HTH domain